MKSYSLNNFLLKYEIPNRNDPERTVNLGWIIEALKLSPPLPDGSNADSDLKLAGDGALNNNAN